VSQESPTFTRGEDSTAGQAVYGEKTAVDGLDFTVRPGVVTGFLDPNGAGKSTTMRVIVVRDAPSSGSAQVNGRRYDRHTAPLQEVGVLLEAKSIHPGRSAFNHLTALTHASRPDGSRRSSSSPV
jgi:ABC-2 type transport system ATP-binding protein